MSTCYIEPLGSRIVIELDESPSKVGRIHVPDTVRKAESPSTGVVMKIGPLVEKDLFTIGDHVLIPAYSGTFVGASKEHGEYRIVQSDEVLAKVPQNQEYKAR